MERNAKTKEMDQSTFSGQRDGIYIPKASPTAWVPRAEPEPKKWKKANNNQKP